MLTRLIFCLLWIFCVKVDPVFKILFFWGLYELILRFLKCRIKTP